MGPLYFELSSDTISVVNDIRKHRMLEGQIAAAVTASALPHHHHGMDADIAIKYTQKVWTPPFSL